MFLCHQDLAFAIPFAKRVFWKGEHPQEAFASEKKINDTYVNVPLPQPRMLPAAIPRGGPSVSKTTVTQPRGLGTPTLPPYSALHGDQTDVPLHVRFHPGLDAFSAVVAGARQFFFSCTCDYPQRRTAMVLCKQEPSVASHFALQVCMNGKDPQTAFNDMCDSSEWSKKMTKYLQFR
jgi:hypothetical protein